MPPSNAYGCYGSQFYETPAIEQLAKEGMLLDNAMAIARSSAVKSGVNAIQDGVIPSRSHAFSANVVFHSSVALQNIQCHATNRG